MPRAEVGTPKYLANKMKSKGLQKLRWYCQVCEKQCRDENGFKCHIASESHLRQMLVVGEHAGKHIADFSMQFQGEFVGMWSRRFGTKRVKANTVYQEYIHDKSHLHMNSTRWVTLTEFIKHLGRSGIAHVDETEKGWFIAWIDNSPKALAKQAASQMKERSTMSDEMRERVLIREQIERAAAEEGGGEGSGSGSGSGGGGEGGMEEGLKRDEEGEKIVLSFKPKTKTSPPPPESEPASTSAPASVPAPAAADSASTPEATTPTPATAPPSMKIGFNALKPSALKPTGVNSLKKNVFKSSASASTSAPPPAEKRKEAMSAAESLILEDRERKRRRMERA